MMRHIAVFRFRDGTTDEEIASVDRGLAALPALIPEIEAYNFGRDLGVADGTWDYAVAADFADEAAFKLYAGHPDHVRVVETFVKPLVVETARTQINLS
jgi:hypothetical protein